MLPSVSFRGSATRYQREHLLALLAIQRLRATHGRDLDDIRARLAAFTPAELETVAAQDLAPGPLADALGLQPRPAPAAPAQPPLVNIPRWQRLELALGLELHLREDASAQVIELSRRVYELCARG